MEENLDWESSESYLLCNPFHHLSAPPLKTSHIILSTSGSKNPKWVYLSKESFLISARAVNAHLEANVEDRWLVVLPTYHVGGLSIYARSFLSSSETKVYQGKWDPHVFLESLRGCTLSSLVPTQLYDLVQLNSKPPASLRGVIVGGDKLDRALYDKARELGWPLYRSYGLTECASQVATAKLNEWELQILPHVEVRLDETLRIKSKSLLTGYYVDHFYDPKVDGWFDTGDQAQLNPFQILGRHHQFKIGGELFSLPELQIKLDGIKGLYQAKILLEPDERLGHKLHLIHNHPTIEKVIAEFNAQTHPLARIKSHEYFVKLPTNSLGKL